MIKQIPNFLTTFGAILLIINLFFRQYLSENFHNIIILLMKLCLLFIIVFKILKKYGSNKKN